MNPEAGGGFYETNDIDGTKSLCGVLPPLVFFGFLGGSWVKNGRCAIEFDFLVKGGE